MEFFWDLFHKIYDVESLVRVGGVIGLTAIVFIETGLLVGFFFARRFTPGHCRTVRGAR